ncbi:MAG: hypothetical protein M5U19_14090 [Microthrixaceae bacterium]|nr:hypothetical protein [Microthrixaceae bacterium]
MKAVLGQRRLPTAREPWWFPVPARASELGIASMRLRFGHSMATRLRAFRR